MRRGIAAVAGLAVVTAVAGPLTRQFLHSLRADEDAAGPGPRA